MRDQLEWIVNFVDKSAASLEPQVGMATCLHRDQWASLRKDLLKTDVNAESLSKIEDCLFILCIDEADGAIATTAQAANPLTAVAAGAANGKSVATTQLQNDQRKIDGARLGQMLHGWGSKSNGGNRW